MSVPSVGGVGLQRHVHGFPMKWVPSIYGEGCGYSLEVKESKNVIVQRVIAGDSLVVLHAYEALHEMCDRLSHSAETEEEHSITHQ